METGLDSLATDLNTLLLDQPYLTGWNPTSLDSKVAAKLRKETLIFLPKRPVMV